MTSIELGTLNGCICHCVLSSGQRTCSQVPCVAAPSCRAIHEEQSSNRCRYNFDCVMQLQQRKCIGRCAFHERPTTQENIPVLLDETFLPHQLVCMVSFLRYISICFHFLALKLFFACALRPALLWTIQVTVQRAWISADWR